MSFFPQASRPVTDPRNMRTRLGLRSPRATQLNRASVHLPASKAGLADCLRALASRAPLDRTGLSELESDCTPLAHHLRQSPAFQDVPETIWHFLSDSDIRYRDSRYAEAQLAALAQCLADMEYPV